MVLEAIFSYMQDFFEKTNDVEKVQKTRFFRLFKKIKSLALSGVGVKQEFYNVIFCENCMSGKNLVFKL